MHLNGCSHPIGLETSLRAPAIRTRIFLRKLSFVCFNTEVWLGKGVPVFCYVSWHDHSVFILDNFPYRYFQFFFHDYKQKENPINKASNWIVYLVEPGGNKIISCKGLLAVNLLNVGEYFSTWRGLGKGSYGWHQRTLSSSLSIVRLRRGRWYSPWPEAYPYGEVPSIAECHPTAIVRNVQQFISHRTHRTGLYATETPSS